MTAPLLAVTGLVKRFGSTTAVDDVTFSVDAGEVVGLLGANGAGKTTVIRMLLGLLRPDAGVATLLGGDTTAVRVRTHRWLSAFELLDEAEMPVTVAGRDVRVIGVSADVVQLMLDEAGIDGEVVPVAATIDERMTVLARASETLR